MRVYENIDALIGRTPLMRVRRLQRSMGVGGQLFVKLELFNPTGSVKDRAALYMINQAEADGLIKPGGTIVEPTSGNTGIGLAAIGVPRGYEVILVMPDTMSAERITLIEAYGAKVVLTPGAEGMAGAVNEAARIAGERPGAFIPSQFENASNARAHEETTAIEILEDLDGDIGTFVAGVGTGGTLTGVARCLKQRAPGVRIVAVEPASSPLLSRGYAGKHGLQGIGANFVPGILDMSLIDEICTVTDADAYGIARRLARTEGILCGITSGAALFEALVISSLPEYGTRPVVALLPDTGTRYMSMGIYGNDFI